MAQTIPLQKVPKDLSSTKVVSVYNPLHEDFVHKFDGEEQVIPSGERAVFPENVAVLLAQHLAQRIVTGIAESEREKVLDKVEASKRIIVDMKPFPRFNIRVGDVAMMLVSDVQEEENPTKEEILEKGSEEGFRKEAKVKVNARKPTSEFLDEESENEETIEPETKTKKNKKTKEV